MGVPAAIGERRGASLPEIHGIHERAAHRLRASSEGLDWHHLVMLDFHEPPFSATFPPARDHLLLYLRRGTVRISSRVGGVRRDTTFYPGQLNLVPANAEVVVTTEDDLDCLHLYVSADMVADVFQELRCAAGDRLVPKFALQDQLLAGLVQACATEMTAPTALSSAYVEHLSWAIAAQLVRTCSSQAPPPAPELQGQIPTAKLSAVDEYIRAHLAHDIGVTDMAKAAGYSPVHFARLFRKSVGMPPYRYLQERRVEAVRSALYSPARLADIAAATGFCNQEHMTRVFREFHGITPGRYRRLRTGQAD